MTKKEERMFALVDAWRESNKKRKVFCDEHRIKVSTFGYWVTRKTKAERSGGGFLPIDVSGSSQTVTSVDIHYPNGIRLSLPAGDVALISKLIRLC